MEALRRLAQHGLRGFDGSMRELLPLFEAAQAVGRGGGPSGQGHLTSVSSAQDAPPVLLSLASARITRRPLML